MSTSSALNSVAYHQDEVVLKIKRALMAIAPTRVLLVDSSKFDVTALDRLAALEVFDIVITDEGLPAGDRARLAEQEVNVTIVNG